MFTIELLTIFISITVIVYLTLNSLSNSQSGKVRRRIYYNESKSDTKEKIKPSKKNQKIFGIFFDLSKVLNSDDSKFRRYLVQAGYHKENSVKVFLGMKVMLAVVLILTFLLLGYLLNLKAGLVPFLPVIGLIGYLSPNLFLSLKIRSRQDNINRNLPDTLDFLVICVEAGLGLNSALVRVGREMYFRSKVLCEEFLLVNQEMNTGVSREDAFQNLSRRNRSKRLNILASSIIVSDHLGTNIADTLRAQADSLRTEFRQSAEEQAAKAGIKILFPLVFFILPTLFIIILGPGLIQMVTEYLPLMNK